MIWQEWCLVIAACLVAFELGFWAGNANARSAIAKLWEIGKANAKTESYFEEKVKAALRDYLIVGPVIALMVWGIQAYTGIEGLSSVILSVAAVWLYSLILYALGEAYI